MSDNNEHQRFLKQQELQEKRIAFYREHGRWPADGEISSVANTQTQATATATNATTTATVEQDDPLDYLFEPRD